MVFKIKTSKKTMEIFHMIGGSEQLQPFVLSKLAIAISIKSKLPLSDNDFRRDTNGLELNRQTITGEHDIVFKALIEKFEGEHLSDDLYIRKYLKAHIDRGAIMLANIQKYSGDFFVNLLNSHNTI